MRTFVLASCAALLGVSPAAANFIVGAGPTTAISQDNDFSAQLAAAGLNSYSSVGSTVEISRAGTLTFEYFGSESGFTDTFNFAGFSFSENDAGFGKTTLTSVDVDAGSLGLYFTSSGSDGQFAIGSHNVGIFLPTGADSLDSDTLWIGFDDQITGSDDDYDDFLLKVTFTALFDADDVIPPASNAPTSPSIDGFVEQEDQTGELENLVPLQAVPAPGALGILGLGLIGVGAARRRRNVA